MAKLTGYIAVAVVKENNSNYHFAIYDDGNVYEKGDKVIVSGGKIKTIDEIISLEEAAIRCKKNIIAEIICKIEVDTSAYDIRVKNRKEAELLKKDMDKIIKEMDETNKYEMYAKQNPALQELLDKFKELTA